MEAIPPFVAEPMAVDGFVDAGLKARNAVLISLDADVAAGAAAGTNGRCFLQVPDAHFETEIAVRQRADGADIDDVSRERVVEHRVGKKRNRRMIAAIDDRQLVCVGDLLKKTDATRALDTALAVKDDVRTKDLFFAIMLFSLCEPARLQIMLHVVILQPALARLIADGTIERVINEKKLHHRFSDRQDFRALRQNRHTLRDHCVAGDLELGHLFDLDETHTAIARDRKFCVIAVVRNGDPHLRRRLNDGLTLGAGHLFTVNNNFNWIHESYIGVVECWSTGVLGLNLSITPSLQYSITPFLQRTVFARCVLRTRR